MENPIEIPYLLKLIGSVFLALVLLGIALILIKKTKDKREQNTIVKSRETLKPFPQTATLPKNALTPSQGTIEERTQTIREHYRAWLERYILPTYDARAAFVRVGVERKRLRYQVSTTSLAQSFAMMQSVLMSGDDLTAPDRFERLLSFAIAYPSSHDENLSTWYTLPDMSAPARLEADPHAESWIAYSLLMAKKQWAEGNNFDYERVLDYRLSSLLTLQKDIDPSEHKRAIYTPVFFDAFAKRKNGEAWRGIARDMRAELAEHVKDAKFALDGSAEEAWLAFSAWQVGLAGLILQDDTHLNLATRFESLVYDAIKTLPTILDKDEGDGLSRLTLLASCAPLAMLQNDQALVDKYWQVLSTYDARERDTIGESLRLLSLMAMNGNVWRLEE